MMALSWSAQHLARPNFSPLCDLEGIHELEVIEVEDGSESRCCRVHNDIAQPMSTLVTAMLAKHLYSSQREFFSWLPVIPAAASQNA